VYWQGKILAGARINPRISRKSRRKRLLALFILGLPLALLLFWLARGPRALLVQALGAATGQPVRLAANPHFFLDRDALGIVLDGLVVGPAAEPLLQIPRLQLEIALPALFHGRLRLRQVLADAPRIRGPWPTHGSGTGLPPLPQALLVRGASVQWTQAGRTLELTHLNLGWQRSRLYARGQWSVAGAAGYLAVAARWPSASRLGHGQLQLTVRSSQGADRLHLQASGLQRAGADLHMARLVGRGSWRGREFSLNLEQLAWQAQSARLSCADSRLRTAGAALELRDFQLGLRPPQPVEAQLQMWVSRPQLLAQGFGIHLPPMANAHKALDPLRLEGSVRGHWPAQWSMDGARGQVGKTHFHGLLRARLQGPHLDVDLQIPKLDLDPYLPRSSPRAGPGQLPALPTRWPVQGRIEIGQLHWKSYTARGVVVEIRP
jgi:hypothetical protein